MLYTFLLLHEIRDQSKLSITFSTMRNKPSSFSFESYANLI